MGAGRKIVILAKKFNQYLKRKYPERSTATHYISDMNIFIKFYVTVHAP